MADRRTALLASLLVLMLAPTAMGCTSGPPTARQPAKTMTSPSTPPVRTDREPLTKRFPLLGDFTEAHWQGGSLGANTEPRVPGPTDVFIHALVVLRPETRDLIISRYQWQPAPAGWETKVSPQLRPFLPANGTWTSSEAFTKEVSTTQYYGTAYLDTTSGTAYLDVSNT